MAECSAVTHTYPPPGLFSDRAAAVGDAQSDTTAEYGTVSAVASSGAPHKMSILGASEFWLDGDHTGIAGGTLSAGYAFAELTIPDPGFNCEVSFYSYAIIYETDPDEGIAGGGEEYIEWTFDANGDDNTGTVLFRQWSTWQAVAANSGDTVTSAQFGDLDIPTWAADYYPGAPPSTGAYFLDSFGVRGYTVSQKAALCRWNVSGGLNYVDVTV